MQTFFVVFGIVVGLVTAGLAVFVATSASKRTAGALMVVGFLLATLTACVSLNIVSVYYVKPVLWIALLAGAVVASVALFVLLARALAARPLRIAALVGLVVAWGALGLGLAISGIGFDPTPLLEVRGRQIAESQGFTLLLPKGEKLDNSSMSVDTVPDGEPGVVLNYQGFVLQERKAGGDLASSTTTGAVPLFGAPAVANVSQRREIDIRGSRALAMEYPGRPAETIGAKKLEEDVTVLLVDLDGTEVRIMSTPSMRLVGGTWETVPPRSLDELARLAETLEPVK